MPIVSYALKSYTPDQIGLDYGSGTGPVVSKLLLDRGYKIYQFDPYFNPDMTLLQDKYHFIVCCEVIEHFHNPAYEFKRLQKMLKPGGKLICMSYLYNRDINFSKWHYKDDPTHTFIYQVKTLKYISKHVKMNLEFHDHRLIVWSNF